MGEIGSKLHYGHPDLLNGIFMTTRGGISKAQRGLHLNEDIYAGITATCRGGRINTQITINVAREGILGSNQL